MVQQARNWCITVNNYETLCLGFNEETDRFMVCGLEVGESGTPHIQGYIQLKNKVSAKILKERFPRAHLEIARGSPRDNDEYCSKGGNVHRHGIMSFSGKRNDLLAIKEMVDSGASQRDIRDQYYSQFIRYQRSISADVESSRGDRKENTLLYISWGETGTGKSHDASIAYPGAYWKSRGDWWDGYDGHEHVIIDEFYGWLPIDLMLRLADRYPLSVPVKGGFRKFVAATITVTSNKPWRDWWPNVSNESVLQAFERRITKVTHYSVPFSKAP